MRAGFGVACVTPAPGKDIPGLFERRLALGAHDDLFARAVVIENDRETVALVQVDAIVVPESVVARARKLAHQLCPVPARNCLIAATHTHSGGPLFGGFLSEPDEAYCEFVARQIAAAISDAWHNRRAALAGAGMDQARWVAFNRRFIMKNGTQRTHPGKMNPEILEPAGAEDWTVTVLGFCDPQTLVPFGCVVNFACHATHMNGYLYSADYVKWVGDTLQAVYGPQFNFVYLNGACGDITQVDNQNPRPLEIGPYWAERTGRVIGASALQALARMDYAAETSIHCDRTKLRAPIRPVRPSACAAARHLLEQNEITADDVETIYANELLAIDALRRERPYRSLEIMGVRIGDAFLWGVPGELFQEFAAQVKLASPFRHTCCVELANGYDGYICTPKSFAGGGYEIRTARSSFLSPSVGHSIVRAAKRLAKRMHPGKQEAPRFVWPAFEDPSVLDGINQLGKSRK